MPFEWSVGEPLGTLRPAASRNRSTSSSGIRQPRRVPPRRTPRNLPSRSQRRTSSGLTRTLWATSGTVKRIISPYPLHTPVTRQEPGQRDDKSHESSPRSHNAKGRGTNLAALLDRISTSGHSDGYVYRLPLHGESSARFILRRYSPAYRDLPGRFRRSDRGNAAPSRDVRDDQSDDYRHARSRPGNATEL